MKEKRVMETKNEYIDGKCVTLIWLKFNDITDNKADACQPDWGWNLQSHRDISGKFG